MPSTAGVRTHPARSVIGFDLDMTLVDLRAATEVALREVNRQSPEKVDIDAIMGDLGAPFREVLTRWISPSNLPAVLRTFAKAFRVQGMSLVTPMPGAHEAIDAVLSRDDDIVVITGRRASVAHDTLAACGLPELATMGQVFGTDKAPVMVAHGISAFVGDHPLDMLGAARAGVLPVGVATGSHSSDKLHEAGAEHVLTSLAEFSDWYANPRTRARLGSGRADPRRLSAPASGLSESGPPEYWASRDPDRPAVVDGDDILTYGQWDDRADRFAEALSRLPSVGAPRVAVRMHQRPEWFIVNLALSKLRWEQVAVNWRLTPFEVAQILADCQPRALIVDDAEPGPVIAALPQPSPPVIFVGGGFPGTLSFAALAAGERVWRDSQAVQDLVMYSSGTTGAPRGIRKEGARDAKHLQQILEYSDVFRRSGLPRGTNRTLLTLPLHHGAGPKSARYCHDTGGCLYLLDRYDPERALQMINQHRITHWKTVPTMLNRMRGLPDEVLARYDMSSIEAVSVGSAPSSPALKQWALDYFGPRAVHEGYGASEVGMVTVMRPNMMALKPLSCGHPRKHVSIRIFGDAGVEVPIGAVGRIFVRTPMLIDRYLDEPHARPTLLTEDGYFDTGDVGRLDEDGYLYITGRSRDMIIAGGVNIYPAEVEQAIGELSAVLDSAVIGVPDPDMGERVIAFCEARPGYRLSPADISEHLGRRLATYKQPRMIKIVDSLPRNSMEKVLKDELRARYLGGEVGFV
jgi:long-chain acyl-CoA synthetase